MNSLLLLRPRPLVGESLASWRQRLAWANGFRYLPARDSRFKRHDWDLGRDEGELAWLSELSGIASDELLPLTFASQVVLSEEKRRGILPPWWLRAAYSKLEGDVAGPMCCPQCLQEDVEPYLRLHWRFAFVTACPHHNVTLRDQCSHCCAPIWPGGYKSVALLSPQFNNFRHCWRCGEPLGASSVRAPASDLSRRLLNWLDRTRVTLGEREVEVHEAFSAAHALIRVFISSKACTAIVASKSQWSAVAALTARSRSGRATPESFDIAEREALVAAAIQILEAWPTSFERFTREAGLWSEHWNGIRNEMPTWMLDFVDAHCRKRGRALSPAEVNDAFRQFTTLHGRTPSVTELRVTLRGKGGAAYRDLYPRKRTIATRAEYAVFEQELREYVTQVRGGLRLKAPAYLAIIAIVYALVKVLPTRETNALPFEALEREIRVALWTTPTHQLALARFALELASEFETRYRHYRVPPRDKFTRSILLKVMARLPSDLAREVTVFS